MMIIGLTGGLGAGKTTIAGLFQNCGAKIIDADQLARAVVRPGRIAWKEIKKHFGAQVFHADHTLNRQALAQVVFQDPGLLQALQHIMHPRIAREQVRRANTIAKTLPDAVIIYDAALLIESGSHKRMDHIIVVTANRQTQISRVCHRDGLTRPEALHRMKQQMPLREKLGYANTIIDGTWPRSRLRPMVKSLYRTYQENTRQ